MGPRKQPRNEKSSTLSSKADSNVVESWAILMEVRRSVLGVEHAFGEFRPALVRRWRRHHSSR
jgi:hypothetical protein